MPITYKDGYRYQLKRDYSVSISIKPVRAVGNEYVWLDVDGTLSIKAGYAWDGPSGPVLHTRDIMRGSLVHDALYQLMREGHLDARIYREAADKTLRDICREDGMSWLLAWCVYAAVRAFGETSADPANDHPLIVAP